MATTTDYTRAVEFERALRRASCEVADAHPLGIAFETPSVPRFWAMNELEVVGPQPSLRAGELVTALDERYANYAHRRVLVSDPETGARLAPEFGALDGWHVERHVFMVLRRPRDRDAAPGFAREVDRATLRAIERATNVEWPETTVDGVGELLAGRDRMADACPTTRFFAGTHDGVDAAHATLYAGDGVGQVEDVATVAAHRGHGLARACCSLAIDTALSLSPELVFIVADAEDWPRELYAKLGFDPVGEAWLFTLPPRAV